MAGNSPDRTPRFVSGTASALSIAASVEPGTFVVSQSRIRMANVRLSRNVVRRSLVMSPGNAPRVSGCNLFRQGLKR